VNRPSSAATVTVDAATSARLLHRAAAASPLWIPARGRSMGWTVPSGCDVLVTPSVHPRPGELWAYCAPSGAVVVHRYRKRTRAGHVLQGDACVRADPPIPSAVLVGRVIAVRTDGRVRPVRWTQHLVGVGQRVPRNIIAFATRARRAFGPS
jgi:hypothetical protein